MAYIGGKAKEADHILEVLNDPLFDGMDYLEPFVGYAHVLRRVQNKRSYTASDDNDLLICLLKGVQTHKRLPNISAARYDRMRDEDKVTFNHAVAAFAYSYAGKEWGGYTDIYYRNGRRHSYSEERKKYYKSLMQNDIFKRTRLRCCDYEVHRPKNKIIYCDPPYGNTTQYNGELFDSEWFWDVMRKWSRDNIVFISEYSAPRDFVCIASANKSMSLSGRGSAGKRRERLYVHKKNKDIFS